MNVLKVDHHNDAMSLATTVEMPEGCGFRAHGQGRVIGFLIRRPGKLQMHVFHLDYPGVIVDRVVYEATVCHLLLPSTVPNNSRSSLFCAASVSRPKTQQSPSTHGAFSPTKSLISPSYLLALTP